MAEVSFTSDGKRFLLSVMAIYGANAAGKSSILHALFLMRDMVCGKYAKLLKGEELPQDPFAFVKGEYQPTEFEIIYYYKGIKYAYGYCFDKEKIITEYLYHWPRGREALIFSREGDKYEFRENVQEQTTLAGRTPENRLYLVSSNEWNCQQTEEAYFWFQQCMYGIFDSGIDTTQTITNIKKGGRQKDRVLKEMHLAGGYGERSRAFGG